MDKKEWLRRLQLEMSKLPRREIDDAVDFYTEYFQEAGPEQEEQILQELGDPVKVAAQIKADYAARQLDVIEREEKKKRWGRKKRADNYENHTAGGAYDSKKNSAGSSGENSAGSSRENSAGSSGENGAGNRTGDWQSGYNQGFGGDSARGERAYKEHRTKVGAIVAAIIGGILAAPIAIPLAIILVVLAVLGLLCLALLVIFVVGIALGAVVAGITLFVGAFFTIATGAGALLMFGAGLLLMGGGLLLGFLMIKGAVALTSAIARAISDRRAGKSMAGGYQPGYYENGTYHNAREVNQDGK